MSETSGMHQGATPLGRASEHEALVDTVHFCGVVLQPVSLSATGHWIQLSGRVPAGERAVHGTCEFNAMAFDHISGDTRAAEIKLLACPPLHMLHLFLTAAEDQQDRL